MTRKCTGLRISWLLLLLPFISMAQSARFDTLGFYNHLVSNNLLREQLAFNNLWLHAHKGNSTLADSTNLNNAILYYKLNVHDSVITNLERISPRHNFTEHSERIYLSMLLLQAKLREADTALNGGKNILKSGTYYNDARLSITILRHEKIMGDSSSIGLSEKMLQIRNNYEKIPHHSAFLATAYSTVIPGLGKWYLGYRHEAVTAFIPSIFLAGQCVESYIKAGPGSGRFIVSASLFGLFYGGNILGTLILAHKQKHDYLKQMDYEILDFHNAVVGKPVR